MKTRTVWSVAIALAGMSILPAARAEAQAVKQWAVAAKASSEFGSGNWAAMQATGEPDTYPAYGDIPTAWAPQSSGTDPEWLATYYAAPMPASGVAIYETNSTPMVVQVDIMDSTGACQTVFTGPDPTPAGTAGILCINFPLTANPITGVTVHTQAPSWEEIDAVALIGNGETNASCDAEVELPLPAGFWQQDVPPSLPVPLPEPPPEVNGLINEILALLLPILFPVLDQLPAPPVGPPGVPGGAGFQDVPLPTCAG